MKKEKTIFIAYNEPRRDGKKNEHLSYLMVNKQKRNIVPSAPFLTLNKFIMQKQSQWYTFDSIIYSSTMDIEFPRDHGLIVSSMFRSFLERKLLKREEV